MIKNQLDTNETFEITISGPFVSSSKRKIEISATKEEGCVLQDTLYTGIVINNVLT
jgi:hypothetical protein